MQRGHHIKLTDSCHLTNPLAEDGDKCLSVTSLKKHFKLWSNTHKHTFTILPFLSVQLSGIECTHTAVQPSSPPPELSICPHLPLLNTKSPPRLPAPGAHHPFCDYGSDDSRPSDKCSHSPCPLVTSALHRAHCPQGLLV